MAKIKMGWAEVDITPNQKINLAGQFYERVSDVIESRLYATAFALESDNDQMIIVSCDLGGVAQNLNRMVKERLQGKLPISTDKVILSAIHTHTSYTYKQVRTLGYVIQENYLKKNLPEDMAYLSKTSGEKAMSPEDALNFLVEKITEAVLLAWENRKEGYYQCAFGRAPVGMCRRAVYDDGSARMWGETNMANFSHLESGNDSGIELIYTFDKDKQVNGVIANIACPAQVVEQRYFISSDYWGKVKENLEKQFGRRIFVLGLCSAAGDQCPRDLIRWVEPETPVEDPNINHYYPVERRQDPSMYDISGLKVVGKRISNEIVSVFEELDLSKMKDEGVLIHETVNMSFPLRRVTIEEYEDAKNRIDTFIANNRGKRVTYEENARLYIYSGIVDRYVAQQTINTFKEEIHVIRFDDIAIATNPYELFLDYGNQIRARSKAKQTFLIQLACGCGGYLPTETAEKGSHYSAYVSSGTTGHVGGEILVRETLERINGKF
ncbi:MAG: neutral/alkaline non-lysosomal ceramidase N-terminal domain-containing protein [Clostridia bacterium]|nr:neutral/alkaline non-lysosomal ceramidase N-terminal domain-containing protein [Clostridia bacterium]